MNGDNEGCSVGRLKFGQFPAPPPRVVMWQLSEVQKALKYLQENGYDLSQDSVLETFTVGELMQFITDHTKR